MYKIVRHYHHKPLSDGMRYLAITRTIDTGLTLEEARAHCNNPETSSSTCSSAAKLRYTKRVGEWFDGYSEE